MGHKLNFCSIVFLTPKSFYYGRLFLNQSKKIKKGDCKKKLKIIKGQGAITANKNN